MHERHRDIYKIGCNRKLRTFKVIFQQFKFSCSRGLASLCGAAASRRRAAWQWGWPRSLPQPRRRCVMHPAQWPQSPRRRRHRPRVWPTAWMTKWYIAKDFKHPLKLWYQHKIMGSNPLFYFQEKTRPTDCSYTGKFTGCNNGNSSGTKCTDVC